MEVVLEGLQPGLAKDPPAMSLTSTAQVDFAVQPVDIHSKICRTSLLPYQYQATIPCFSNSALFLQFLSVPHVLRILLGALACLAVRYGYLLRLAVRSHTVPLQLVHKPYSQIDQFKSLLSEFSTLHPFSVLLQLPSWLGLRVWHLQLQIEHTLLHHVGDLFFCFH